MLFEALCWCVSNFDLFPKDFQSNLRHISNAIKLKLPSLIIVVQRFLSPKQILRKYKKLLKYRILIQRAKVSKRGSTRK